MALALALAPRLALAQTEHEAAAPAEEHAAAGHTEHGHNAAGHHGHEAHHRFNLALTGTLLGRFSEEGVELLRGGGLTFGVALVPHHLDLEVTAHVLLAPEGFEVPVDLVAVVPFRVNRWFEPYIAAGGTVVPFALGERTGLYYGIATVLGTHFWLTHTAGFIVEFNYNALWNSHGDLFHDVGGTAGPVIAF